jgi:hypothetical protein
MSASAKIILFHPLRFLSRAVFVKLNQAVALTTWNHILELSTRPYYQVGRQLSRSDLRKDAPFYAVPFNTNVEEVIARRDRLNTMLDLARLALSLQHDREIHGVYPEVLEDLTPDLINEIPQDPLSGKPYVYRRQNDDFVLYSVSANGVDDGALPNYENDWKEHGDVVWKAPR